MASVNEAVLDLQVRHQVGLQRLSAGVIRKIIAVLADADKEITAELMGRPATLEGSFTSQRLKYLLDAVRQIMRDATITLGQDLRGELRDLAKYEADFQASLLTRSLPVAMDIVTPSAQVLNAVVTSRPFQGRLLRDWVADLDKGAYRRLQSAIQQGIVQGETVQQIVTRVRGTAATGFRDGILEVNRRQATNLVRTAVNHVATSAREKLYEENDDLVGGVIWVATLDTRTCEICMGYDGQEFSIDRGPRPPAHPSCRCTTMPRVKSWRELGIDADEVPAGTRASMNGQVPATLSFDAWLKSQSAAVQDEALGPTRGRLFRDGGLTVDRFTDARGNQLNLDELRRREADAFDKAGIAA
jgi:SPP1 gp7 family putative phage head morphogenesis protein